MKHGHFEEHWTDDQDRPAGGVSSGQGFTISWQNGPPGRHVPLCKPPATPTSADSYCDPLCMRQEPNGAFVEDVIAAVVGRIEFYQASEFACGENEIALAHLRAAARELNERTKDRETRSVEGTHEQ